MVYKTTFIEKINDSIINELQKIIDGKAYNQDVFYIIKLYQCYRFYIITCHRILSKEYDKIA
jgi:hypothetical protein